MESVPLEELNHYVDCKKTLYELLTGEDFKYYLPPFKSNSISVDYLLKLGNDKIWAPTKDQIKMVDKRLLKGLDKVTLYQKIKDTTQEDLGWDVLRLPPKSYLGSILFFL